MIRPEAAAALTKWREVGLSLALMTVGIWVFMRPGLFYGVLGAVIVGAGAGLALSAWRRLRFKRPATAAGLVEIDEGQVSYFGPETGGVIALADLARIELRPYEADRAWHLVQIDGQSLTIPVAAKGAELLYDVISALPNSRPEAFLAALSGRAPVEPQVLWRRAVPHSTLPHWRP